MRIATWNVNSIRAREERLLRWLGSHRPDVLCLQELKVAESQFPSLAVQAAGYHAVVLGQPTYNGVAILSRERPEDVRRGLEDAEDDNAARLISARIGGVRILSVYVPNGQSVGSEKYSYKLRWLRRLRAYLGHNHSPDEPLALCGDLNVAPEERDVAFPMRWASSVLFHQDARAALADVRGWGLLDAFRLRHAEGGHYSWWDYRMLAFPKGDGLRIDHVLATPALADRCTEAVIDREQRKGKLPSDHAPVIADFSD